MRGQLDHTMGCFYPVKRASQKILQYSVISHGCPPPEVRIVSYLIYDYDYDYDYDYEMVLSRHTISTM